MKNTQDKNCGVEKQLSGKDNDRLYSTTPVNSSYTAALTDIAETMPGSNVSIPSEESVEDAKDWVDNGSQT